MNRISIDGSYCKNLIFFCHYRNTRNSQLAGFVSSLFFLCLAGIFTLSLCVAFSFSLVDFVCDLLWVYSLSRFIPLCVIYVIQFYSKTGRYLFPKLVEFQLSDRSSIVIIVASLFSRRVLQHLSRSLSLSRSTFPSLKYSDTATENVTNISKYKYIT